MREIVSDLVLISFCNNCFNSRSLLLAYCRLANPSLVQVFYLAPGNFRQLFGTGLGLEVGDCFDAVGSCLLHR